MYSPKTSFYLVFPLKENKTFLKKALMIYWTTHSTVINNQLTKRGKTNLLVYCWECCDHEPTIQTCNKKINLLWHGPRYLNLFASYFFFQVFLTFKYRFLINIKRFCLLWVLKTFGCFTFSQFTQKLPGNQI